IQLLSQASFTKRPSVTTKARPAPAARIFGPRLAAKLRAGGRGAPPAGTRGRGGTAAPAGGATGVGAGGAAGVGPVTAGGGVTAAATTGAGVGSGDVTGVGAGSGRGAGVAAGALAAPPARRRDITSIRPRSVPISARTSASSRLSPCSRA